MKLQIILKLKIIFVIIFLNINSSYADSIVKIPGLYREISCLSSIDQPVFRLIILDLNSCQTCNIWFPKIINNGDTGIFIYFKGARIKDKEKLAKHFKIATSRVLVGSLSDEISETLFKYIFVEAYENDDWVSAYTVNDVPRVSKLCDYQDRNDITIQSEEVFSRFDRLAASGNYIYGISNPLMQLARIHKDSSNIEIYPSSKYDSYFLSSVYPELYEKDSTLLTKTEYINRMASTDEIFKLFYPVSIFTENNRLFIATQPFIVHKTKNQLSVSGINLIVEIDENWNIINHWQTQSDNNCSPIVGFFVHDNNFYFASIELDGQYLHYVECKNSTPKHLMTNKMNYNMNLIKQYEFMKYSSNTVETGVNTLFFCNRPVVTIIEDHNKTSSIDLSVFTGMKLHSTSLYNNLSTTYKNDTLTSLCAIDGNVVLIKVVSGQLVSRSYYSLQDKYNPIFAGTNESGYLFYQTKEDYFKRKIEIK